MNEQSIWHRILRLPLYLAVAALIMMMLLTCADVVGRYLLNQPVMGAFQGTQYLQATIVFLGAAWTQVKGGHVKVEVLYSRLPASAKPWIDLVMAFLLIAFGVVLTWKTGQQALYAYGIKEFPDITTKFIPVWLFRFIVSFGSLMLTIEFIMEFVDSLKSLILGRKQ